MEKKQEDMTKSETGNMEKSFQEEIEENITSFFSRIDAAMALADPKKCLAGEKVLMGNAIRKANVYAQEKNKTIKKSYIPDADFLAQFYGYMREELLKHYSDSAKNFLVLSDKVERFDFTRH